jgi:hypothetical protein
MRRPPTQHLTPISQAEFEAVYGGPFSSVEGYRVHSWHQSPDGRVLGCMLYSAAKKSPPAWARGCYPWGIMLFRQEALGIWCVCRWSRELGSEYAANLLLQIAAKQILERA